MAPRQSIIRFALSALSIFRCFEIAICGNGNENNNIHVGLHLNTSSNVLVRVGEPLKLNCIVFGSDNSSSYQLVWFHGTRQLTNVTKKLKDGTVQLVIDHVGWGSNGTYTCKETSKKNSIEPKQVHVRVGDIPSPPQDVWANNVEFKTRIHWTSPAHSGGLQLSYVVKAQCKNETLPDIPHCQSDFFTLCNNSSILSLSRSKPLYKWYCVPGGGLLFETFVVYNIFVEVRNALGSNQSSPIELKANMVNPVLTTPLPAKSFFAEEVSPSGTVKLSWDAARVLSSFSAQYTILYHREGQSYNRTLISYSPNNSYTIPGLSGFWLYYFYLLIQYGDKDKDKYGSFSQAVVYTIRTKISAPSHPPKILHCSIWSNRSHFSGLRVTWKIPPLETLNGPLKNMNITSRCQTQTVLYEVALNVTSSNATVHNVIIHAPQLSGNCYVWMRICNGPQYCSAISNTCVVDNKKDVPVPSLSSPKGSVALTVVVTVVGALAGLALVVVVSLCIISRRRKRRETRPPLAAALGEVFSPPHGYDEIDGEPLSHSYDVISG